jgi:hypothetical protein
VDGAALERRCERLFERHIDLRHRHDVAEIGELLR